MTSNRQAMKPLLALPLGLLLTLTSFAQRFAPAATYVVGTTAQTIAAADVNGDERLDLLTANSGSNSLSVLLNQAAAPGTFPATATSYACGGNYPVGLAVGDLNGDGLPDVVLGNQYSEQVSVLLNLAAAPGTFAPAVTYATGHATRGVALGDVNGDGRLDIVASSSGSTVSVLLNVATRPGTFLPQVDYACGGQLNESLAVGDVTGDGRADIVVANNANNTVSVLRNSATAPGTFGSATTFGTGGQVPRSLALGDVNGDGQLDIVVANSLDSTVGVLLNTAASPGIFPASAVTFPQPGAGAVGIAVGDMNGDGQRDIVTANYHDATGTTAGVLLQAGASSFATGQTYPSGGSAPHSVALGDFDGDGKLDVALAHLGGRVGVLLNNSGPLATSAAAPVVSVALYPNPAHGSCTVVGLPAGAQVRVVDALGRLVGSSIAGTTGTAALTLAADLPAGVYLVQAGTHNLRLLVE